MTIDEMAIIASLLTGFATLTVAIFLAIQLRMQNIDSKTELELQIQERWDSAIRLAMEGDGTDILTRGRRNIAELRDEVETSKFHWICASAMNSLMLKYSYGTRSGFDRERHIKEFIARSPGIRNIYRDGRLRATFRTDHQQVLDNIVKSGDDEVGVDGVLNIPSDYPYSTA